MKSLIAALQFLTICPFVSNIQCSGRQIGRSTPYFPLVGIIIGGAAALLDHAAIHFFPPLLASAITVIAMIAASGALHMDGLGDTADGFLSSRPRERILEIMKDSHAGAMAVITIGCVIVLKIAALASIPVGFRLPVVFLMPLAGRCALVFHLAVLDYARAGGLATLFVENRRKRDPMVALIILAAAGWFCSGQLGMLIAGLVIVVTLVFSYWCKAKIGGFTGDTLGASCEIIELIPALIAAAYLYQQ